MISEYSFIELDWALWERLGLIRYHSHVWLNVFWFPEFEGSLRPLKRGKPLEESLKELFFFVFLWGGGGGVWGLGFRV